jgi:hypothetical protein
LDGSIVEMGCDASSVPSSLPCVSGEVSMTCTYASAGVKNPWASYGSAYCVATVQATSPCVPVGQACTMGASTCCASGGVTPGCYKPGCVTPRCCVYQGGACTDTNQCCCGECIAGICECKSHGTYCTTHSDCVAPYYCTGSPKICQSARKPAGSPCSYNSDCNSCDCSSGTCN